MPRGSNIDEFLAPDGSGRRAVYDNSTGLHDWGREIAEKPGKPGAEEVPAFWSVGLQLLDGWRSG